MIFVLRRIGLRPWSRFYGAPLVIAPKALRVYEKVLYERKSPARSDGFNIERLVFTNLDKPFRNASDDFEETRIQTLQCENLQGCEKFYGERFVAHLNKQEKIFIVSRAPLSGGETAENRD